VGRIPTKIYKIEGPALEFRVHDLIKHFGRKKIIPKYSAISKTCPICKIKGKKHKTGPKEVYHSSA